MGKSTIDGPFSIAMLNYQRVNIFHCLATLRGGIFHTQQENQLSPGIIWKNWQRDDAKWVPGRDPEDKTKAIDLGEIDPSYFIPISLSEGHDWPGCIRLTLLIGNCLKEKRLINHQNCLSKTWLAISIRFIRFISIMIFMTVDPSCLSNIICSIVFHSFQDFLPEECASYVGHPRKTGFQITRLSLFIIVVSAETPVTIVVSTYKYHKLLYDCRYKST